MTRRASTEVLEKLMHPPNPVDKYEISEEDWQSVEDQLRPHLGILTDTYKNIFTNELDKDGFDRWVEDIKVNESEEAAEILNDLQPLSWVGSVFEIDGQRYEVDYSFGDAGEVRHEDSGFDANAFKKINSDGTIERFIYAIGSEKKDGSKDTLVPGTDAVAQLEYTGSYPSAYHFPK